MSKLKILTHSAPQNDGLNLSFVKDVLCEKMTRNGLKMTNKKCCIYFCAWDYIPNLPIPILILSTVNLRNAKLRKECTSREVEKTTTRLLWFWHISLLIIQQIRYSQSWKLGTNKSVMTRVALKCTFRKNELELFSVEHFWSPNTLLF